MFKFTFILWILNANFLIFLFNIKSSQADILPDNTLPVQSQVISDGNIRIVEGGTKQGEKLFHSFRDFSFSVKTADITGNAVYFNNDLVIKNIITRVTGGLPSNIDGIIKANGNANLFLINPQGIIFGQNSSLNIGGSFIATTADSIKFFDGTEYSATFSQANPLLTVSVPIGLQFGLNSGAIINQSQASLDGAVNINGLPAGLQVKKGQTLALVGGNVRLEGGNLTAARGRVELGGLATDSFVGLNQTDTGYVLKYTDSSKFADIQLSTGAYVDTSGEGGGTIQIQGKNITLTGGSQIISATVGVEEGKSIIVNAAESINLNQGSSIATFALSEGAAGDILITARESIELIGASPDQQFFSGIGSQVLDTATANGGNLNIQARRVLIRDGAIIDASTFGIGQAGNISIKASDSIQIIGTDSSGFKTSGIFTQVAEGAIANAGDAGDVTLETRQLTVLDGGQISSATFAGGKGGNVLINASESIQLSGSSSQATRNQRRSGLFVSSEPSATDNVGDLKIISRLLKVENGAEISANNFGSGKGGSATLDVERLVVTNGGEVRSGSFADGNGSTLTLNATESVDIVGTGTIAGETIPSTLFSQAQAGGNAGNLVINTPILNVRDGAEVTVSAKGTGAAGNLTVGANTIRLNRGKLTAETAAGNGANINLNELKLLRLENQSLISAQAFNQASGGNININAPNGFIVAFANQNNDIVANTVAGQGGKISINARSLFNLGESRSIPENFTNDIDASSEFGLDGEVFINTPDVDPSRGLVELPSGLTDASQQIASSCNPGVRARGNSFSVTGRSGMAPSPTEPLQANVSTGRWITLDAVTNKQSGNISTATNKIVEAQGWVKDKNGDVILVARTNALPHGLSSYDSCY